MLVSITVVICKMAAFLTRRLMRGGGQALPGLLADYLDPHLAGKLAAQLPQGVILVTGTNGKTTTTKVLVGSLEAAGETVITNSTGSNLKRGVTSALLGAASWRGKLRGTMAAMEVDEASLRRVTKDIQPRLIVVLNLFRDQLDRYGELDTTAALIGEGIAQTSADVLLNADDPLVASLATYAQDGANVQYFGIEGMESGQTAIATATDTDRCPRCHERLTFSRTFYGHIGHYHCVHDGYKRPHPDVAITSTSEMGLHGSRFEVSILGKRQSLQFALAGVYNLYNALAVVGALAMVTGSVQSAVKVLAETEAAFGRVERIKYRDRTLCLLLIKNPAGFTQVVQTFLAGRPRLAVLVIINDLDADGRDVSWLWDVPLEVLRPDEPRVFVSGIRAADMAVRFKYAGIPAEGVVDVPVGVESLIAASHPGDEVYILPTYTAMTKTRNMLSKLTRIKPIS
ncbi:MAG TPA: MurT ligase domain-containing protein [Candidatus Saccharimonadia bacterium]